MVFCMWDLLYPSKRLSGQTGLHSEQFQTLCTCSSQCIQRNSCFPPQRLQSGLFFCTFHIFLTVLLIYAQRYFTSLSEANRNNLFAIWLPYIPLRLISYDQLLLIFVCPAVISTISDKENTLAWKTTLTLTLGPTEYLCCDMQCLSWTSKHSPCFSCRSLCVYSRSVYESFSFMVTKMS